MIDLIFEVLLGTVTTHTYGGGFNEEFLEVHVEYLDAEDAFCGACSSGATRRVESVVL